MVIEPIGSNDADPPHKEPPMLIDLLRRRAPDVVLGGDGDG
jgi:hypothetical protein